MHPILAQSAVLEFLNLSITIYIVNQKFNFWFFFHTLENKIFTKLIKLKKNYNHIYHQTFDIIKMNNNYYWLLRSRDL